MSAHHDLKQAVNVAARLVSRSLASKPVSLRSVFIGGEGNIDFLLEQRQPRSVVSCLRWQRHRGSSPEELVAGFGGFVTASESFSGDKQDIGTVSAVAGALGQLPERVSDLLIFREPSHPSPQFDKRVTGLLFGPALAVDKTRWAGFRCAKIEQQFGPPSVLVHFSADNAQVAVRVTLDKPELVEHGEFPLVVSSEVEDGHCTKEAGVALADFVSFLLARRVGLDQKFQFVPELEPERPASHWADRRNPWEYGASTGWNWFFHPDEVAEAHQVRRLLIGPHVEVLLGERECFTAHASFHGPDRGAFRFPGLRPWPATYHSRLLASTVSEAEVVTGAATQTFVQLLDSAHQKAQEDGGVVIVSDTCVSTLLGADADVLMRNVSTSGISATEIGENIYLRNEQFLEQLLERARGTAPVPLDGVVNLVGFQPGRARDELTAHLAALGVQVGLTFLPDMDVRGLPRLWSASCCVAAEGAHRPNVYDAVQRGSGLDLHVLPPPYTVKGTGRWLRAVCALAGIADVEEKIGELEHSAWSRMRGRHSQPPPVLFVHNEATLPLLDDGSKMLGIPVLDLLGEAEFPISCAFVSESSKHAADVALTVQARHGYEQVWLPAGQQQLAKLLASRPAPLVYSDSNCDWRVLSHGMNTFCLQDFEMGFEGAFRTVSRLLRRAANRFIHERLGGESRGHP